MSGGLPAVMEQEFTRHQRVLDDLDRAAFEAELADERVALDAARAAGHEPIVEFLTGRIARLEALPRPWLRAMPRRDQRAEAERSSRESPDECGERF